MSNTLPMREHECEFRQVYDFIHSFFVHYYTNRDAEKVLSMVSKNAMCISLGADEVALDRDGFAVFLHQQVEDIPFSLPYSIHQYIQKPCGANVWTCFCHLDITICTEDWGKIRYNLRLTATIHKEENQWLFDSIHVSEAANARKDTEILLYGPDKKSSAYASRQRALGRLVSQLVPGGIVSSYLEENFPLSLANTQLLRMLGFSSYTAYSAAVSGYYINSIHPEDRERYSYHTAFARSTNKQCECEYRLLRQDGTYIWVHDTGRKALDEDGRDIMVSTLIDITEQVEERRKLEQENDFDALTGVCNRKGAQRRISSPPTESQQWFFIVTDLDNFKKINDIYGHKQGDRVLCWTADRLQSAFHDLGIVCRLGGDEFAVYIPEYPEPKFIEDLLQQVSADYDSLMADSFPAACSSMSIGGVYGVGPGDSTRIYEHADKNLYEVKRIGALRVRLTALP